MAMTKEEQQVAWSERKKRKAVIATVEEIGLTKEKYEQLKSEKLSDGKIIEKFPGLYPTKLYNWKKAVGLIDAPAETTAKPANELDDDTKSRLSELKDRLNTPKTSQEPQEETVEDKTTVSVPEAKKAAPVDSGELQKALQRTAERSKKLETENERLTGKLERVNAKNAELSAENEKLYQEKPAEPDLSVVEELKAENAGLRAVADHLELAQSEIHALTEQVRELERYQADYTALEQLHRETRARLHAAEEEAATVPGLESMKLMLMRDCLRLHDKLEGVYA